MAFSPDGGRLAVADLDRNLRVLDLRPARSAGRRVRPAFPIHLSFSPDGETLAIGLDEGGAELRDGRSLGVVARLRNRTGDVDRWVRFSPDGRLLAVSTDAGYTQLWDVAGRERIGAAAARSRARRAQCGVLARRAHARDERDSMAP